MNLAQGILSNAAWQVAWARAVSQKDGWETDGAPACQAELEHWRFLSAGGVINLETGISMCGILMTVGRGQKPEDVTVG